jgi:hypothetical protein
MYLCKIYLVGHTVDFEISLGYCITVSVTVTLGYFVTVSVTVNIKLLY